MHKVLLTATFCCIALSQQAFAQVEPASTDGWVVHEEPHQKVSVLTPPTWEFRTDIDKGVSAVTYPAGTHGVACIVTHKALSEIADMTQKEINHAAASEDLMSDNVIRDEFAGLQKVDFSVTEFMHGRNAKVAVFEGDNPKGNGKNFPYRKVIAMTAAAPGEAYTVQCMVNSEYAENASRFNEHLPTFIAILNSADLVAR